jgi:pimeloyl-ACP methyl ester carboxylesterase
MYYEIHGSGPPLVLLHGAFESAERWTRLVSKLRASHQIIIVEQQGHGHTADRTHR